MDLELTDVELELFDRLKIENTKQYDRFGNIELMKEEIPQFLREIGNRDERLIGEITDVICKVASNVTRAFEKETSWICVRAFTPTNEYDIPRWHTDGNYYAPFYGVQYKFAATFKGSQTLFYPMSKDMRKVYFENHNDREFLSKFFEIKDAESVQNGYGAFFIVGNREFGALHSEPKIDTPRLFISVVPGHECEIEELNKKWHP